jgi:hypothetical protein
MPVINKPVINGYSGIHYYQCKSNAAHINRLGSPRKKPILSLCLVTADYQYHCGGIINRINAVSGYLGNRPARIGAQRGAQARGCRLCVF